MENKNVIIIGSNDLKRLTEEIEKVAIAFDLPLIEVKENVEKFCKNM